MIGDQLDYRVAAAHDRERRVRGTCAGCESKKQQANEYAGHSDLPPPETLLPTGVDRRNGSTLAATAAAGDAAAAAALVAARVATLLTVAFDAMRAVPADPVKCSIFHQITVRVAAIQATAKLASKRLIAIADAPAACGRASSTP